MSSILGLLFALLIPLLPAAAAHAHLIGITIEGDLYRIDPATGDETFVASSAPGANGLALDPDAGRLYTVTAQGLVSIDPAMGAATVIGGTGVSLRGLAFSPAGEIFGVRNPFANDPGGLGGPDVLVRIDPMTGIQTTVGSLGGTFDSVQALSFLGTELFAWDLRATGGLANVDPLTGRATDLPGGTDLFQDIQALAPSAGGTFLWGSGRGFGAGLGRIDPLTGEQQLVAPPFDNLYRGIEDLDRIVPEPRVALLLIAACLATRLRSRRGERAPE